MLNIYPEWSSAQITEEWRATYTGPYGVDGVSSMCIDAYGNVYVTGSSLRTANIYEYATVKYSTSGVQQWVARYNWPGITTSSFASAYSVAADNNGNAYVTGVAPVSSSGQPGKITTVKYNLSGIQQWVSIFYDEFYQAWPVGRASIAVSNSSNIYVAGSTTWPVTGYDYTTIKYNSFGVQQWVARYSGTGTGMNQIDELNCIVLDNSENVYVTGAIGGDSAGYDIATVKYNSSGVQQWAAIYNGPGNWGDSALAMAVDNSGNVYVTGRSWGGDATGVATGYDYITIKYNSMGIQQWAERYTSLGNRQDYSKSIAVDNSGNVYVTGYTINPPSQLDCATIKYNTSGIQQWVKFYDNGGADWGVALALDNYGNVYVTAASDEGIRTHFATIKYTPSGEQEGVIRTYSANGESPAANAVDSLGNVYVSGSPPYLTIKYNQTTGIIPVTNEIPNNYFLSQNFPNPFNPVTNIKFDIPKSSFVKLAIYDVVGKQVYELVNDNLAAGSYSVDWNAFSFASGVYFYRIEAGEYVNQMKMVLVK